MSNSPFECDCFTQTMDTFPNNNEEEEEEEEEKEEKEEEE